jgi:hypothetical protein
MKRLRFLLCLTLTACAPAILFVLGLTACATPRLTVEQAQGLDEARRFVEAAARAYGVRPPTLMVAYHEIGHAAGYAGGGWFYVRPAILSWAYRDAALAHEFSHYLLHHDVRTPPGPKRRQAEMEANAKGVEVLMRAKGWPESSAAQVMAEHLLWSQRVRVRRQDLGLWRPEVGTPDHDPCEELRDLVKRFPIARDRVTEAATAARCPL